MSCVIRVAARSSGITALVLLGGITSAWCAIQQGDVKAIAMLVQATRDGIEILRAQPAGEPRPPRRTVALDPLQGEERPGGGRLVVEFIDAKGHPIEGKSVSWPARSVEFIDQASPGDAWGLTGRRVSPRHEVRFLHISLPASASYLHFYRSESSAPGPAQPLPSGAVPRPRRRSLAVFDLWRAVGTPGRGFVGQFPSPPGPTPVPGVPVQPFPWWLKFGPHAQLDPDYPHILDMARNGFIIDYKTPHSSGDPANSFDIVILGDGFQEGETPMFEGRAGVVYQGILAMEPFQSARGNINVHVVKVASTDSGVDESPWKPLWKKTYFNVKGDWEGFGSPSDFGTPTPAYVWDAAIPIAPPEQIELFVVLVNSGIYGGKASPDQRIAFLSLDSQEARFIDVAAHEIGHVIANLDEEDLRGVEYDPNLPMGPNVFFSAASSAGSIDFGAVPWAADADKHPDGGWKAIHFHGDKLVIPWTSSPTKVTYTVEPVRPDDSLYTDGEVGLFWGCMYIEPEINNPNDVNAFDARGRHFYRPSARCKMRRLVADFCKVCAGKMKAALVAP